MSNNYGNRGFGADAAEQARHNFEQTKENSIDKLASFSSVKVDDNGKSSWMGFEVPTEVAGTLQYISSILPNYVNNFLRDGVYENSERFFNKFNKSLGIQAGPNAGRKFGLGAAAFVGGGLIAAQPVSEIVHSVHQRRKDRLKIKQAISAVIETNSGYKDNEVIKTAMERVNKTMIAGFKHAASELPTVILNGYYARESHKNLVQKVEQNAKFRQVSSGDAYDAYEETAKKYDEDKEARKRFLKRKAKRYSAEELKKIDDDYLENQREQKRNSSDSHHSEEPKNTDETTKLLAISVAGGANAFLKSLVAKGRDDDNKNPSAYELITDLQEKITNGNISKGSDITSQIVEIFQQNEIDRGRHAIGPALMEKFNPIAARIAEVISNRELDAISLVNFVGEGKIVNKRHFISVEQLDNLIDTQRKVFSLHEKTPLDDFLADFQHPKMIMQAIKESLKTLDGDQKAVFASMFPEDVLIAAGVKKKDIPSLRARGHDFMSEFVKSSTVELAKKSPEELKAKGLSEQNIEAINNLNGLIVAGDEKGIKAAISDTDNSVVSAVRTAGLNTQVGGDKMYWTKIITKKPQITATEKPAEGSLAEAVKAKSGRENGANLSV